MTLFKTKVFLLGVCMLASASTCIAESIEIQTSEQGVSYITGGIGIDEVDALKQYINQFNLHLLFSQGACGHAIVDVDVDIYDAKNQRVLQLIGVDPQLFVKLDRGRYRVVADHEGLQQGSRFTVTENGYKKVVLHWKDCVDAEIE